MGSVTKVRMNSAGAKQLLNDPKVKADMKARATRILAALPTSNGEQWEVIMLQSKDRPSAMVRAKNAAAKRTAAETHAIQRALGAGK